MDVYGSCLCREVGYRLESEFTECSYCHCSVCRKLTGSAFASYGGVPEDKFHWTKGQTLLKKYSQSRNTNRWFCSACGSYLMTEHALEPDMIYVSLGSVDGTPDIQMAYHQFYGSRINWCDFDDSLNKYDEWSDNGE